MANYVESLSLIIAQQYLSNMLQMFNHLLNHVIGHVGIS